jgi:hypothetical protein
MPADIRKGKGSEPPRLGVPNNPRRGPAPVYSQKQVSYIARPKRQRRPRYDDQQIPEY